MKMKKIWVQKVKVFYVCEKVEKVETKHIERKFVSKIRFDGRVRSWRNEKRFYGWFNEIFDSFCVPNKKPISKFSQISEVISRSKPNVSPKQWVCKGSPPVLIPKWVPKISC